MKLLWVAVVVLAVLCLLSVISLPQLIAVSIIVYALGATGLVP